MKIRTWCTPLGVKYYIYKKSKATEIVRYWDRKKGMWSKWFSNDCYYNTDQGVNRIYNKIKEKNNETRT